jgi:hypothetical protein
MTLSVFEKEYKICWIASRNAVINYFMWDTYYRQSFERLTVQSKEVFRKCVYNEELSKDKHVLVFRFSVLNITFNFQIWYLNL